MICEWCGGKNELVGPGGLRFCSEKCQRAARVHAIERFEARLDGEDPPSKEDIDRRFRRAERWTLDKMRERVAEFRRVMDA